MTTLEDPGRPFAEMQTEGLLWLINASVFHPRGYALAFHEDGEGNVTGWSLIGDGSGRWVFAETGWPAHRTLDDAFRGTKRIMP